jgi:hypothetical protein
VFGINPFKTLVKLPAWVPSVVLLLVIVGSWPIFQHTPRMVISDPPSEVIFPPDLAVVIEMLFTSTVEIAGT